MSPSTAPSEPIIDRFLAGAIPAVDEMMRVVRAWQIAPRGDLQAVIKAADDTVATLVDRLSGEAGGVILREYLPEVPQDDEETGLSGETHPRYIIWKDPLDGTKMFSLGAGTETVILALYDTELEQVVAGVVAHPGTGRVWCATSAGTFILYRYSDDPDTQHACNVWGGPFDKGTVLVDALHPFKAVSTRLEISRLTSGLAAAGIDFNSLGSNGLHQALVADQDPSGPKGFMGSITIALGGPWDAAFALGVIAAGGAAKGLRIVIDGSGRRSLEACDPLDPTGYDILITAQDALALARIEMIVRAAFV